MAPHSVAPAEVGAWGKTLAVAAEDTVTFGRDCKSVRVYNDSGTAAIWFTVNGTAPAVNGQGSYRVRAIAGDYTEVDVPNAGNSLTQEPTTVRLISSGTPTYSVEGSL